MQAVPRRCWVVSPITVRDVREVFALRALLEPEAARLAACEIGTSRTMVTDALLAPDAATRIAT